MDYIAQLRFYQQQQLELADAALKTISNVWSPEVGLRTSIVETTPDSTPLPDGQAVQDAPVGEEATATDAPTPESAPATDSSSSPKRKIVLYNLYSEKILPLLAEVFADPVDQEPDKPAESIVPSDGASGDEPSSESSPVVKSKEFGIFEISLADGNTEETVNQTVHALLPAAKVSPPRADAIPATVDSQLIKRPYTRIERKAIRNFEIVEYRDEGIEAPPIFSSSQYRWVIPAMGNITFKIRFKAKAEGKVDSAMMFEVMGSKQEFSLYSSGKCEVPKVNGDSRIVFMKRVKSISPGLPLPIKRFATADNCYSFGPLLCFKEKDWRIAPPVDAPSGKCFLIRTFLFTKKLIL